MIKLDRTPKTFGKIEVMSRELLAAICIVVYRREDPTFDVAREYFGVGGMK